MSKVLQDFITEVAASRKATKSFNVAELTFKEVEPDLFHAFYKGEKVAQALVWKDLEHGKPSIYKSATKPGFTRKGIMRALYQHIEAVKGIRLTPSSTLSQDGFEFWNKFRPEAVANDARRYRDLVGKEVEGRNGRRAVIYSVGSGGVMARYIGTSDGEANSTTYISLKMLRERGLVK